MKRHLLTPCVWMAALIFSAGCATQIRRPATATQMSTVRFSEFENYVLQPIEIAPAFADARANQRAARRIEQTLVRKMQEVLPGLTVVDTAAAEPPVSTGRTLRVQPKILEIKFISGAARFWVGAMAGSSAVLMKVEFVDQETGTVVAQPEFYRAGSASAGATTMGVTDNRMLDEIAREIANYTRSNL